MQLLALLSIPLAQSILHLHYQLWAESGQTITDQSGNGYSATNGSSVSYAIPTARGFFFNTNASIQGNKALILPANSIVVMWVLPLGEGVLFSYKLGTGTVLWKIVAGAGSWTLQARIGTTGFNGILAMPFGVWTFLVVSFPWGSTQIIGYNGANIAISGRFGASTFTGSSIFTIGPGNFIVYDVKIFADPTDLSEALGESVSRGSGGCPKSCESDCVRSPEVLCLPACGYIPPSGNKCDELCSCSATQCVGKCTMCTNSCSLTSCSSLTIVDCLRSELCHSTCLTCSGASANQCISCFEPNSELVQGECRCKFGYYTNSELPFLCSLCQPKCGSCSGGTESDCLSCRDLASFDESHKCVCDVGTFPNPDSANCQLCDSACLECVGRGPNQCSKCKPSAYLVGPVPNSCACSPGFYADLSACVPCSRSCATCLSLSECQSCKANAELKDGECACKDGFFMDNSECSKCSENCSKCSEFLCASCKFGLLALGNECTDVCPLGFRVDSLLMMCEEGDIQPPVPSLTVSDGNDLLLHFDKPMKMTLASSDISVALISNDDFESEVSWNSPVFQDPKNVEISLIFESSWMPTGCGIELTFIHPDSIKDEFGISINVNSLIGTLNAFGSEPKSQSSGSLTRNESARQAAAVGKAGVSAGITASLVNGSPSSVISLINQIQLITYLAMTKLPLTEDFAGTLAALNVEFMLPVPKLVDTEVLQPPQFAVDYGIDSTLFISNTFVFLATSGLFAVAFILVWLLSKNRSIGSLFKRYLDSYKWSIPLNLWLTSYLDLAVFALLHIRNTPIRLHSGFVVLNWILSGAVVVCVAATPIVIIVFLYRNFKLVASQSDAAFNSRWAVFLEQFKPPYSLAGAGYYPLFATRRVVLALTLTVTYDFLIPNMLLNTAIGIISFLFLVAYRPYKEKLDLVEAQVTEAGTVMIYFFASFFAFDLSSTILMLIGGIATWIVRLTIAVNVGFSIFRSGLSLFTVLKLYRERMKARKYQVQDYETSTN